MRLYAQVPPWSGTSRVLRVAASPAAPQDAALTKHRQLSWDGGAVSLPSSFDYIAEGDVLRVVPTAGEVSVLYRRASPHNSMLLTERCNSRCLMCSQPPKSADDGFLVDVWLAAIPLMDKTTGELGLSGGEPTLLGDRFLELLRACKESLPATGLHVLSNGRLFNYLRLARELSEVALSDLMVGIPVYSDLASHHDFVVQAAGAFDQTIRGIVNLKRCGIDIELRVVLHAATVDRLPQLARFIARNLPFVDHVALMGLELMGYAKTNLNSLWIEPATYQSQLVRAVTELEHARMNVSIYNHQLCVLDRSLWPYARKSISDWKNDYVADCETCAAREKCGGFFESSKLRRSASIRPLSEEEVC